MILIFSDVHGNLPAFEKMLASNRDISKFICLGDIVNYGPWSNECVDLLETLDGVKLVGNHEEDFLKGEYAGKSELVKMFYDTCIQSFSRQNKISRYEGQFELSSFTFKHTIQDAYIYSDSVITAKGKFFIGHSHYQFERKEDEFHVVNVGSVGQNRKEINVVNYALYEPEEKRIELKSLIYDVHQVIKEMRSRRYPQACIDYYRSKGIRT